MSAQSNLDAATYDLLGMIDDNPVPATWEGIEYEGTSGSLVSSKKLEPGGFLADYDLQWVTSLWKRTAAGINELVERFPEENASVPEEGDQLTIRGVAYLITRKVYGDYEESLTFDLATVNK